MIRDSVIILDRVAPPLLSLFSFSLLLLLHHLDESTAVFRRRQHHPISQWEDAHGIQQPLFSLVALLCVNVKIPSLYLSTSDGARPTSSLLVLLLVFVDILNRTSSSAPRRSQQDTIYMLEIWTGSISRCALGHWLR